MGKRDRDASEKKKSRKRSKRELSTQPPDEPSSAKPIHRSKSVFVKKKVDISLSLYPGSLRDCEGHVQSAIGNMLLKYSEGLGGVLMAYDKVKLKVDGSEKARGWILNELPHVHYNASCDALVFRPHVGCQVRT